MKQIVQNILLYVHCHTYFFIWKKLLKNPEGESVGQLVFFFSETASTMWYFLYYTYSFEYFYFEGKICDSHLLYYHP